MKLQVKPAIAQQCTWGGWCKEAAVGELRAHNLRHPDPWPMCRAHIQPEAHPSDLRGRLFRWTIVRGGA